MAICCLVGWEVLGKQAKHGRPAWAWSSHLQLGTTQPPFTPFQSPTHRQYGCLHPPGRGAGNLPGGLFSGGPLGSLDDEFGLSDLSDLLFGLSKLAGETQRPNARKLLAKIFLTRVKLQAPPAGPAAVRHGQRLQRDAAEEAEVRVGWVRVGWGGNQLNRNSAYQHHSGSTCTLPIFPLSHFRLLPPASLRPARRTTTGRPQRWLPPPV